MTTDDDAAYGSDPSLAQTWARWRTLREPTLEACRARWSLDAVDVLAERVNAALYRVSVRGRAAVLKIMPPGADQRLQADVLAAAGGAGYVHLYDRDDDLGALLLEPLGSSLRASAQLLDALPPALALVEMRDGAWLEPMVQALSAAWQVSLRPDALADPDAPGGLAAQRGAFIEGLAARHRHLGEHAEAIERALTYARHRAQDSAETLVVCHGDPQFDNLLAVPSPRPGAPGGYVWVDPAPVRSERERDLGLCLRDLSEVIMAADDPVVLVRSWCARAGAATGTDAELIWQWAHIERVAAGLQRLDQGWPARGRQLLDAATWLVARRNPAAP